MSTLTTVLIVIAVLAIAFVIWAMLRSRKTERLRSKFGPEYDRLVECAGGQSRAETELSHREQRVNKLNIRDLTPRERERFAGLWRTQQQRFVDDPREAVMNADVLVTDVMEARGYPMSDFQTQAADISVDHAHVVANYREAHDIAEHCRNGQADTEEMRRAMVYYRALFEDLLGVRVVERQQEEVRTNG